MLSSFMFIVKAVGLLWSRSEAQLKKSTGRNGQLHLATLLLQKIEERMRKRRKEEEEEKGLIRAREKKEPGLRRER
jgi:hypothetical protein